MTIYPRRPEEVLTCTETYVEGIVQVSHANCEDSGSGCVWTGNFEAIVYNAMMPVTYTWTTSVGIINDGQGEAICELWIDGTHPLSFELTIEVDCPSGTHTKTMTFETSIDAV